MGMVSRHVLMDPDSDRLLSEFAQASGCSYSAAIRAAALLLLSYEPIRATKIGSLVVLIPRQPAKGQSDAA